MNSRGDWRSAARSCLRVVNEVVWDNIDAGDRLLLRPLLEAAEEPEELVLLLLDPDEEPSDSVPRRRKPLPRAHRPIVCSIVDAILLNRRPPEEEEEEEDDDESDVGPECWDDGRGVLGSRPR